MSGVPIGLADFEQTIVAIASCSEPSSRGVVRLSGLDVADILSRMNLSMVLNAEPMEAVESTAQYVQSDSGNGPGGQLSLQDLDRPSANPFAANVVASVGKRPRRIELLLDSGAPLGRIPVSLLYWPTGRSYTGQPSAEFHLIGSEPLLREVVDGALSSGARAAKPGEFTLRAFLGGRLDLTQAEAVLGVIEAEGRGALNQALEQLSGNLSRPLEAMRDEVLNLLADVEAGLDFVDEDIEFISDEQLVIRLERIRDQIVHTWDAMQQRSGGGVRPVIALRGEPNAGKSFLMNRLTGEKSAIVADVPGTTRDVVVAEAEIHDRSVMLADTAGIEAGRCAIERESQVKAKQASEGAVLRLWCIDSTRPDFREAFSRLRDVADAEKKLTDMDVWVATKADKSKYDAASLKMMLEENQNVNPLGLELHLCSALTGDGILQLSEAIKQSLDSIDKEEVGSLLGTAARCRQTLMRARDAAEAAITLTQASQGHEFVAAEIRSLAESIGEVTGTVYTDDLLDRVFSRFCIGK